jgi:nucleotidyltransferase/DNA polymerase involved in DNA repair
MVSRYRTSLADKIVDEINPIGPQTTQKLRAACIHCHISVSLSTAKLRDLPQVDSCFELKQ